jgi:hypothetical protein
MLLPVVEGAGAAIRPPADGWRAQPPYRTQTAAFVRGPRNDLPHHPVVNHRGGFSGGS